LPHKLQTTCSIECVSERCTGTIFWPSEIPWCVDTCLTEGLWWYSETSEIAILFSKQAQESLSISALLQ